MENWRKDNRREPVITDVDALVPKDHLLRKIDRVMDYEWLYERLEPYYCHDNGRPGTDPVVLIFITKPPFSHIENSGSLTVSKPAFSNENAGLLIPA